MEGIPPEILVSHDGGQGGMDGILTISIVWMSFAMF